MSRAHTARPADRRRLHGLLLTLVAVVAVALLWLGSNPFASHTDVRARFSDVSGIAAVATDVRVGGVKVGRVTGRRRAGDAAELTLRLDGDAPEIHADARAALRPTLLFEGKGYIDLTPGSAAAPALGDGVLPVSRTRVYVPLAEVLEVLGRRNAANLRQVARSARRTLDPAAQDALRSVVGAAPRLTATLGRTARAARGAHGTELRSAVGRLSRTADAVAAHADDLPDVVRDGATTLSALRSDTRLDAALAALPSTVARLRTGSAALDRTVTTLRPLARELRPAVRAATPTVDALRPVLRAAAPALRRAAPLLGDLRAGLDSGRDAAAPTRRLVAAAKPTVGVLDGSLLAAAERRTTLGTPAYLAFLGLFAGGGGASRPFGIGGADGHFMRFGFRFVTGLAQPLPPCDLLVKASPSLAQLFSSAGGCTP